MELPGQRLNGLALALTFRRGLMNFVIFFAATIAGPLTACVLAIRVVAASAEPGAALTASAGPALPFLGAAGIIAVSGVFSILYGRKIVEQMEACAPDPQ